MPEVPIREAADLLGVSLDTVRRRIRSKVYTARRDVRGWILVQLPDDAGPAATPLPHVHEAAPTAAAPLPYAAVPVADAALLAQVMQERDHLQEQVKNLSEHLAAVLRQADDDARERAELRQMLRDTQLQLADAYGRLAPRIPQETAPSPTAPGQPYAGERQRSVPGLVERIRRFLYGERR